MQLHVCTYLSNMIRFIWTKDKRWSEWTVYNSIIRPIIKIVLLLPPFPLHWRKNNAHTSTICLHIIWFVNNYINFLYDWIFLNVYIKLLLKKFGPISMDRNAYGLKGMDPDLIERRRYFLFTLCRSRLVYSGSWRKVKEF